MLARPFICRRRETIIFMLRLILLLWSKMQLPCCGLETKQAMQKCRTALGRAGKGIDRQMPAHQQAKAGCYVAILAL